MPVVSMLRLEGDPVDLARRIREHVDPVSSRLAPRHGGLLNLVAQTNDGILVVNLWENEEDRHAMAAEPEVQEALRAAGLPPPSFEGFEVLSLRVSERAAAAATA